MLIPANKLRGFELQIECLYFLWYVRQIQGVLEFYLDILFRYLDISQISVKDLCISVDHCNDFYFIFLIYGTLFCSFTFQP